MWHGQVSLSGAGSEAGSAQSLGLWGIGGGSFIEIDTSSLRFKFGVFK